MRYWSYFCPYCNKKINTKHTKDEARAHVHELFACERCLFILKINEDLTVSDFQKILKENKKKRKAESMLQEPERIEVVRF